MMHTVMRHVHVYIYPGQCACLLVALKYWLGYVIERLPTNKAKKKQCGEQHEWYILFCRQAATVRWSRE